MDNASSIRNLLLQRHGSSGGSAGQVSLVDRLPDLTTGSNTSERPRMGELELMSLLSQFLDEECC